ncbi:MAG: PLP-dependent transferase [Euryarchaeota archaeon]|nr:PLP-dependent transferase [Euryarchaeota archaeon]
MSGDRPIGRRGPRGRALPNYIFCDPLRCLVDEEKEAIETRLIHAGQPPNGETGAVVVPISPATTYAQANLGEHKGYEYGRTHNPTRQALEACIADVEGGKRGFAFASGMSAIQALSHLFKSGDHLVVEQNCYGGTYRFLTTIMKDFGLETTYVDSSTPKNVEAAIRANTKAIHLETPTNPNLNLCDLKAISEIAKARKILTIVDNTFSTPYLQRPHSFGIDVVVHSATKYIGGHSDVIGGLVTTTDQRVAERIAYIQNATGAVPSPFDCFLQMRGLKTLHLRMDRHSSNAMEIAKFLSTHPKVKRVHYPGLPSHPQHALAKKQMRAFGGMVSFDVGTIENVKKMAPKFQVGVLAESLGAVETLICHPATMTHASIPKAERERSGITDGLVRISVGLENVDDIKADVKRALDAI